MNDEQAVVLLSGERLLEVSQRNGRVVDRREMLRNSLLSGRLCRASTNTPVLARVVTIIISTIVSRRCINTNL